MRGSLTSGDFWPVFIVVNLWGLTMAWRLWVAPRLVRRRQRKRWWAE